MLDDLYDQPWVLSLFERVEFVFDLLRVLDDFFYCEVEVGRGVIF